MRGSVLLILAMTGVATLAQITSPEASLSAPDTDSDKVLPESLVFIKELRNFTKEQGDSLKVRCEVRGDPPANKFRWFFNEAPLLEEPGRLRVKNSLKGSSQSSVLRFQELEVLDKGYYRCEASNGLSTIKSTSVINVVLGLGSGRGKKTALESPDYLHLPDHRSYQDPFQALDSLSNGIDGLPDHIEFDGRNSISQSFVSDHQSPDVDLPSLKPNEKQGQCQQYVGAACREVLGDNNVWVSTDQRYVEEKLAHTFNTITKSNLMSDRCEKFAIAAICHSTFPLCDVRTKRPRNICREECEVLEKDICKSELAFAKSTPGISYQMGLPECDELPPIGSIESHNCVRMGLPDTGHLIKPHSCYNEVGESYRGTHSMTSSGQHCKPWKDQTIINPLQHYEILGGHNYCRNPAGPAQMEEPWCFTDDRNNLKQVSSHPAHTYSMINLKENPAKTNFQSRSMSGIFSFNFIWRCLGIGLVK